MDHHPAPPAQPPYPHPAGGWGSIKAVGISVVQSGTPLMTANALRKQNKPGGFACVSCAWAKPAKPHLAEFCENGAKATAWELTDKRADPDFFAAHTLSELRQWGDLELEGAGRLTEPLRYDPTTDRYLSVSWDEAFAGIGRALAAQRAADPRATVFYASGRASLETSYMYQLLARLYGNNNLPDSSNMCHETTSVALKKVIGVSVGTCVLSDFHHCDSIFFFGQNPGTNSPRLLHPLQEAVKRGCKIVTFNPIREKGLEVFKNPQSPVEMLTPKATQISTLYLQVKAGGDIAAIMGMIKYVLAEEERQWREKQQHVLDVDFLEQHTTGFEEVKAKADATSWEEIERESGLARADIEEAAQIYVESRSSIAMYGMGLTQHVHGFDNLAMLTNLWLLRGNVGREGAGISPVRGHSNVQGQRTVGIAEKPELVPLDKLAEQFGFEPPRDHGLNTVAACEKVLGGELKAFIGLGGNFIRAIPEREKMEAAWTRLRLTVQIATKLNRSHLINGEVAYLLPCLGRSEEDLQETGAQAVTMEDSLSCIHGSLGKNTPASEHLKSELAIVAGIAKATLPPNPKVRWDEWVGDYAKVRDCIAETYPEMFYDFNDRVFTPGGFYRGNSARERIWKTESGKAQFTVPESMRSIGFEDEEGRYRLITLRSNDQFNTTIYGYSDRLRGIEGTRDVVLMNPDDIAAAGLSSGQVISLVGDAGDDVHRQVDGLTVTPFLLPRGCIAAYYPEMNPLMPVWYHDKESGTPAAKGLPVRIVS